MNLKTLFSNPRTKARILTFRCDVCAPFPCELEEPDVFGPPRDGCEKPHKVVPPARCPSHRNKIAKWKLLRSGDWLEVGMTRCRTCNNTEQDDINVCSKCNNVLKLDTNIVDDFLKFLQGKYTPKHFILQSLPQLSADQAFSIIYVLQEWLHLIPDIYEKCSICNGIYNTEGEGVCLDTADKVEEYNEMGYNFTQDDVGKFFCGSCERSTTHD